MFIHLISRGTALKEGHKHYFTGKPCKSGHISQRRVSSARGGCCLMCEYERVRTEKARAYGRAHRKRSYHADKFAGNPLKDQESGCFYLCLLSRDGEKRIGYGISCQPDIRTSQHARNSAHLGWTFEEVLTCCYNNKLVPWYTESLFKQCFKPEVTCEIPGFKVESVEYHPETLKRMLDILRALPDNNINLSS